MTRQEAFDIIVRHLLTQRCRATRNGDCRYRGDNGTKDAVGALISDKQYEVMMRTGLEWSLVPTAELIGMSSVDRYFLRDVQVVHDGVPVQHWDERLREIAKHYNLTYPEVSDVLA